MAKLVCQTGPTAGHEYPLTKDVTTMGRQSSCDVQILDNMSSRVNCQIRRDGKLFSVVDLGSRNGTNLNGKKVTERQLTFGDRIRIGEAEYLFVKEPGDVELRDLLSKYEVQEKLGEGGMGIVYKANQRSMNRSVALKILSPKYSTRPRFVEQFIREARAAGQLNHPNIIQVHDVGTENNIHYFSMEFVDGPTCMQALREHGPFKTGDALEIIRQTAKALEYAHSQRLIHQDIKPDNIMLGNNSTVKLADLGISKTFDEAEMEEGPKRVMGTPHYMAPEAALGKKIDHRVDIYSLGATLYHLLTGKTPYTGTSATEVLKAHVMDPLPPIHDMVADVPEPVCALVERMVAKKPEDRYSSANQIVEEIQRLQTGLGLGTERISSGESMLLRTFANPNSPTGVLTPAAATTGTRNPQVDERAKTGERPPRRRRQQSYETWIVLAVVVILGLLVLLILGGQTVSDGNSVSDPRPTTVKEHTSPTIEPTTTQNQGNHQDVLLALSRLDEELKNPPDQVNLKSLSAQVEALMTGGMSEGDHQRALTILNTIKTMMQKRSDDAVEKDFSALRNGISTLLKDHDYDSADKRVDAFKDRDKPLVKDRVATLRADIDKERKNYITNLNYQIGLSMDKKSISGLKEIEGQLPPAFLNSQTDNQIKDDIKTLENQITANQKLVLEQARAALASWQFSDLDDIKATQRADMGDSTNGRQLDTILNAGRRLAQLPGALQEALSQFKDPPLYRGHVTEYPDPYITSADASALHLQVDGAIANVSWEKLPLDTLTAIIGLVLPKELDSYRSALNELESVKRKKPAR